MMNLKKRLSMVKGKIWVNAGRFNNNKGEGIIAYILFTAILVLAIVSTNVSVQNVFTNAVNDFSTWLDSKLTALFA